jgi:hypothetical protein
VQHLVPLNPTTVLASATPVLADCKFFLATSLFFGFSEAMLTQECETAVNSTYDLVQTLRQRWITTQFMIRFFELLASPCEFGVVI